MTPLVPSEMACLASSPGRMRRTEVWISRDEMVDFLLYEASLEASPAMRSKMSLTNELVTTERQRGCPDCLTETTGQAKDGRSSRKSCSIRHASPDLRSCYAPNSLQDHHCLVGDTGIRVHLLQHLVDVGRVGLGTLLLSLLLVTIGGCRGLFGGFACLSSGGLYERAKRASVNRGLLDV